MASSKVVPKTLVLGRSCALPRVLPPQIPFETYKVVEGFWWLFSGLN